MTTKNLPPVIILVGPQLGENIGMVARAMANFGMDELRLVAPREGWLTDKTYAASASAEHIIRNAPVFETLEAALEDVTYVVATTARQRDNFKPVLGPERAIAQCRAREATGTRTAILFGREKSGLSNDEISRADVICTFPINAEFASLNIAQSVLLMAYEWMRQGLTAPDATPFEAVDMPQAPKGVLFSFLDWLEPALESRGFFKPIEKKAVHLESLRALFSRPGFTTQELSLLRGMFAAFERFGVRKEPLSVAEEATSLPQGERSDPTA
jgi:tRNA/rRNA methyltransferase